MNKNKNNDYQQIAKYFAGLALFEFIVLVVVAGQVLQNG